MKAMNFIMGGAVLFGALTFGSDASAITPEKKGTFKIGAERMLGLGLSIQGGDANFGMTLLPAPAPMPLQFPRLGADYFIIDGLSLGGNLGMTYWSAGGGQVAYIVLPRVGYEFELTDKIDFWPRGGVGIIGAGGGDPSFLVALEGMFVWEFIPHVAAEFGPTIDLAFGYEVYDFAGNAGLLVSFD